MAVLFNQDFFEPTPAFAAWVKDQAWLRYRRIIEVGAGRGLAGQHLLGADIDWIGLDLNERPELHAPVQLMDGLEYRYSNDDVILVCRPCHNGFVEAVFDRAADRYSVIDFLYVGLEKNLEADFNNEWELELLLSDAGAEGEKVWRVYGRIKNLDDYVKVQGFNGYGRLTKAVNRRGESEFRSVNAAGGYMPIDPAEIVDTKKMADPYQNYFPPEAYADGSKRAAEGMIRADEERGMTPTYKGEYGWVAPDAAWWPCGSANHEAMLTHCFGLSSYRARRQGWIKCYGTFWANYNHDHIGKATPAQIDTLASHGYDRKQIEEERALDSLPEEEQQAVRVATFKTRSQLDGD